MALALFARSRHDAARQWKSLFTVQPNPWIGASRVAHRHGARRISRFRCLLSQRPPWCGIAGRVQFGCNDADVTLCCSVLCSSRATSGPLRTSSTTMMAICSFRPARTTAPRSGAPTMASESAHTMAIMALCGAWTSLVRALLRCLARSSRRCAHATRRPAGDSKLLLTCSADMTVKLWAVETGECLFTYEHRGCVRRR